MLQQNPAIYVNISFIAQILLQTTMELKITLVQIKSTL